MGIYVLGATFALVHILFPDHWLPFVLVGKAQRWNPLRTSIIAIIGAFLHSLTTIIIGITIHYLGGGIPKWGGLPGIIPAAIIILLGLRYIYLHIGHKKGHSEQIHLCDIHRLSDKTAITSLILMISAPRCIAFLPIFLSPQFDTIGKVLILGLIYISFTIFGMAILTFSGSLGILKLNLRFLEDNEYMIMGIILIIIGIFILVHGTVLHPLKEMPPP